MTETIETPIIVATKELCRTIVQQPEFQSIRRNVDAFMADETAKSQYQLVVEKGEALQHKQQMGLPLTNDEISEFEKNRDSLVNNPVAKAFLDAQQEMQKVQESVGQLVAKTFELGRIPSEEEMSSCGSGCGCH